MLTQKILKVSLKYNQDTGLFIWKSLPKKAHRIKVGDVAGCTLSEGYVHIKIKGKNYLAHRLVFLYVHGYFPEGIIDHRDRNPSNNKLSNLREVSHSCNIRNTGNHKTTKSGVKGVTWCKNRSKWKATIGISGSSVGLGYSNEFSEAVCLRLAGEQFEQWENCDSSSPAYLFVKGSIQNSICHQVVR